MKKIIIAFNGSCYPQAALEFAGQLNKTQPVLLTAVFIPQAAYSYLWSTAGTLAGPIFPPLVEEVSNELVEINHEKFNSFCKANNIKHIVHHDIYDFVLPELVKETRFSDLLIVESGKFYDSTSEEEEMGHLKDLLEQTECPVLIVPEKFDFPQKNIITYDGSASSVSGIKQFAYIFPELANNETVVVFSKNEEDAELPDEALIQELASQHYKKLKLLKLNIEPKKYFATWLSEEKSAILISGSFGRSSISQLLRKSFVTRIITEQNLPVFIAHR